MARYISGREKKRLLPLSAEIIRDTCRRIFPKRNDFNDSKSDSHELIEELGRFGIGRQGQLKSLLTKHRRTLLEMDRAPFDVFERATYEEWHGRDQMLDHYRRQFFTLILRSFGTRFF